MWLLAAQALALLGTLALARAGNGRVVLGLLWAGSCTTAILWLTAVPVREDDYFRYLWDGETVRAGVDPYRFSPLEVLEAGTLRQGRERYTAAELNALDRLEARRATVPEVFARVSHPDLPTIYPPLSLAVFAAAAPWKLAGLRAILFALHMAVLAVLVALLRRTGRPLGWAALYGWHPLVAKELLNSVHHDVIAVLPLLLFFMLWLGKRPRRLHAAAVALGFAILAKLFAIVLLPVFWRSTRRASVVAVCAGTVLLGYLPFLSPHVLGSLPVFAREWNYNEGFQSALRFLLGATAHPERWAKAGAAIVFLGVVAWSCRRPSPRRAVLVLGALFLLGPVQHPWYATWFLPLLAVFPNAPLLLAAHTVTLYYLHFLVGPNGSTAVLWAEHLPVWAWIGYRLARRLRHAPSPNISPTVATETR